MKKVFLLLFFLLLLTSCNNSKIKVYTNEEIDEFNKLLENVGKENIKAYDLRDYEECKAGRIKGFFCAKVYNFQNYDNVLDVIVSNITILLGKKKKTLIILIDNDGKDAEYVANKLKENGFQNIHYFQNGYLEYVRLNPDFVPETGECEC